MAKRLVLFLASGLAWLFIYALPISSQACVYDVVYHYVVDTRLMYWCMYKVKGWMGNASQNLKEQTNSIFEPLEDKLSQNQRSKRFR